MREPFPIVENPRLNVRLLNLAQPSFEPVYFLGQIVMHGIGLLELNLIQLIRSCLGFQLHPELVDQSSR